MIKNIRLWSTLLKDRNHGLKFIMIVYVYFTSKLAVCSRLLPFTEPNGVVVLVQWEARTGQLFYNLLPAERERANQEISAAKQTQRPK